VYLKLQFPYSNNQKSVLSHVSGVSYEGMFAFDMQITYKNVFN